MPDRCYGQGQRWPWFALAVAIIVFDQLAKLYFNGSYEYGVPHAVIPGVLNFTLMYNPGAAFSFLASAGGWQKHVFSVLAFIVSGWLAWNIAKGRFSCLMNWAGAFIIGGALGNVVDRLAYGHVVDFIQVYYRDWYYPTFNLADSFICVGAALMVLDSFKKPAR